MTARLACLFGFCASFTLAPAQVITSIEPESTLLAPGTRSISLTVKTVEAIACRYALNRPLPFDSMSRFLDGDGTRVHRVSVANLSADPSVVNHVYVRCGSDPSAIRELLYRAVAPVDAPFPRTGNLWGYRMLLDKGLEHAARVDLHLGADYTPDQLKRLRQLNPHILVLTSINAIDADPGTVPEDFYLKDVRGNRIEVWPGSFRLNLTKPGVAEFQARSAYNVIVKSGMLLDGCFFDNFMTDQAWLKEDIHGNRIQIDADEDGRPDDPRVLDRLWREGLFREMQAWRRLMPNAYAVGHLPRPPDPDTAAVFNGDSIGFLTPEVIEGKTPFSKLWDVYNGWFKNSRASALMMVESAPPSQISYGYGFFPVFGKVRAPDATLEFARSYYPYMRFGLGLTLMNDGFYAHEFGDTFHGNDWWYDELDSKLGYPLGPAKKVFGSAAAILYRRDFTNGTVLLNPNDSTQTVNIGSGYHRLKGNQAPRYEAIIDDTDGLFHASGNWRKVSYDSGLFKPEGPYFHSWGKFSHRCDASCENAQWQLSVPDEGAHSISAWWPAAPESASWTRTAIYELVVNGRAIAAKTLDQSSQGDQWHELFQATLPRSGAIVRLRNGGGGSVIADALWIRSVARYNDGAPAASVTLQPFDAIILRKDAH